MKNIRIRVLILIFLTATPLYAQKAQHSWYIGIAEMGVGFSNHGVFMDIEGLLCGIHLPKPFGLEVALARILNYPEQEGMTFTLLPLGAYFPILTLAWKGDPDIVSLLNLLIRANLLNSDIHSTGLFPPFFDLCLEWRSYFYAVTAGYRRQIKSFQNEKEHFNMSGFFISVQFVAGWVIGEVSRHK